MFLFNVNRRSLHAIGLLVAINSSSGCIPTEGPDDTTDPGSDASAVTDAPPARDTATQDGERGDTGDTAPVDTAPTCTCGAKVCGNDGCGGTCGTCGTGEHCAADVESGREFDN